MIEHRKMNFESDLRVSPRIAVAVLLAISSPLLFVSDTVPNQKVLIFALCSTTASALAWFARIWNARFAGWSVVLALVVCVVVADLWLNVSGGLILLAVPTALAAPLIGVTASVATAFAETVLLVSLARMTAQVDSMSVGASLSAVWAMVGVMYAVYRPVHLVAGWSCDHLERAQSLLNRACERQAQLRGGP